MLQRVEIEWRGRPLTVTLLTRRFLQPRETSACGTPGTSDASEPSGPVSDVVREKARLVEAWSSTHSDDLAMLLKGISASMDPNNTANSGWSELEVLGALACDKALLADDSEVAAAYHRCRQRGGFQAPLVFNNLAVIEARQHGCAQTLDLLRHAIRSTLDARKPLRTPFENAAILFHRLHEQGFVFKRAYLDCLDEILQMLDAAGEHEEGANPGESRDSADGTASDFTPAPGGKSWTDEQVRHACRRIARHAHKLARVPSADAEPRLYAASARHLLPEYDVFSSFGDVPDGADRQASHRRFRQAAETRATGDFGSAIDSLSIARALNPELAADADELVRDIIVEWRDRFLEEVEDTERRRNGDSAADSLTHPPDERLRRPHDGKVGAAMRQRECRQRLSAAEAAEAAGRLDEAKTAYIEILRRDDLPEGMSEHVSTALARIAMGEARDE